MATNKLVSKTLGTDIAVHIYQGIVTSSIHRSSVFPKHDFSFEEEVSLTNYLILVASFSLIQWHLVKGMMLVIWVVTLMCNSLWSTSIRIPARILSIHRQREKGKLGMELACIRVEPQALSKHEPCVLAVFGGDNTAAIYMGRHLSLLTSEQVLRALTVPNLQVLDIGIPYAPAEALMICISRHPSIRVMVVLSPTFHKSPDHTLSHIIRSTHLNLVKLDVICATPAFIINLLHSSSLLPVLRDIRVSFGGSSAATCLQPVLDSIRFHASTRGIQSIKLSINILPEFPWMDACTRVWESADNRMCCVTALTLYGFPYDTSEEVEALRRVQVIKWQNIFPLICSIGVTFLPHDPASSYAV